MIPEIYKARPFMTRNADEYELEKVLNLFVSPIEGLTSPFDYENNIIKGRMGSGKTMYLRANHAWHLYGILPGLMDETPLVLPVMIRLSDFQHIQEPSLIYRSIIIKIIEELSSIYLRLQDIKHLARIHMGIKNIAPDILSSVKFDSTIKQLIQLGADQYIERIKSQIDIAASIKPKFFESSAKYNKEKSIEIQKKANPGIKDIEECYKILLEDHEGKILLLVDEAGALDKSFFRSEGKDSFFEILMNQLRTASFIRTKVAIYPNSYQDILTETRYGDIVTLEEFVKDESGYIRLRQKALKIIEKYTNSPFDTNYKPEDIFDLSTTNYADTLEQLIYASGGNLRRLVQLFDLVMDRAFADHGGNDKILLRHVWAALERQSHGAEGYYNQLDSEFLSSVAKACKARSTYLFRFPYMSPVLNKFTSRSQEYNLLNVIEIGSGQRGTTYSFDYSYCVAHDIPTHYIKGSEKIDKDRSLSTGDWITRVTTISEDIIKETIAPDKIDGSITYLSESEDKGFVTSREGKEYFFVNSFLIESDRTKRVNKGLPVRFMPLRLEQNEFATNIEIIR